MEGCLALSRAWQARRGSSRVLSDEVVRASLLLSFLLCLLFSAKELWHVHIPVGGRLGCPVWTSWPQEHGSVTLAREFLKELVLMRGGVRELSQHPHRAGVCGRHQGLGPHGQAAGVLHSSASASALVFSTLARL